MAKQVPNSQPKLLIIFNSVFIQSVSSKYVFPNAFFLENTVNNFFKILKCFLDFCF